jgi:hypothetical protein
MIKQVARYASIALLCLMFAPANGAVISTCSAKQLNTVKNNMMCKKSGIINRWVPVVKTTNKITVPIKVETKTAIAVKVETPVVSVPVAAVEIKTITSFSDLLSNSDSVPHLAWKNASEGMSDTAKTVSVQVIHGPNTTLPNNKAELSVTNTYKIFNGFKLPDNVLFIYYSYADIKWAQEQFFKYTRQSNGSEASRMCATESRCWGAQAELGRQNQGVVQIAVMPALVSDDNHLSGMLEAHELMHTVQSFQFVGTAKEPNSYCCTKAYMPWWMVEGLSEYSKNIAINYLSFDQYLAARKQILSDLRNINDYGWVYAYISSSNVSEWSKPVNEARMYDIGFLVTEAIAAIYGPKANLRLFERVANGLTFEEAFYNEFSQQYSTVQPVLAEYITKSLTK